MVEMGGVVIAAKIAAILRICRTAIRHQLRLFVSVRHRIGWFDPHTDSAHGIEGGEPLPLIACHITQWVPGVKNAGSSPLPLRRLAGCRGFVTRKS